MGTTSGERPTLAQPARGAVQSPRNRFEQLAIEIDPEHLVDEDGNLIRTWTTFLRDDSQSIITYNKSPDVPFDASLNPYRGCEHGCSYCFARPTHEYLGYSAGIDFESKILVKDKAPDLLRAELTKKSWRPQVLAMSGVTDCYQPVERRLELTRRCLAVLAEFRNPVAIITKNHLVTRDLDLLRELAAQNAVTVAISITTLDGELAKKLEPRASTPVRRLAAVEELSAAGIPVRVMFAPVIPAINDHEMPAILQAAAKAGARDAAYVPLRLPLTVAPVFQAWLEEYAPGSADKVLSRVRDMRGGKLNDPRFGSRMAGEGIWAEHWRTMWAVQMRRAGLQGIPDTSTASFRVPRAQMDLEF